MKRYIATVGDLLGEEEKFKIYFDQESNTLIASNDEFEEEEVYDFSNDDEDGNHIIPSDKEIIDTVYGMYHDGSPCFSIIDCIEFED